MEVIIKQHFNIKDIEEELQTTAVKIRTAAINTLSYVGEECIKQARDYGSYNDITGNLRSSIGYVVLMNGHPVVNSKSKAFNGPQGDGSKGISEGEKLLDQLTGNYPKGIVLIVAAGMEYAVYVEDLHHKDVLTSSKLLAEKLVPELLDKIGLKRK